MIEEVINLVMALTSVAITLLDPMMQIANGVDLYMEAVHSSPLVVRCPPRVDEGSWSCSGRRPLPECSLFCPSGLVPADESQVDCNVFRQDANNFSCVPAGVVIIGGLDEEDEPVTDVEVFPSNNKTLQRLLTTEEPSTKRAAVAENTTMISASTEWYDGRVVTCGGVYQMSCSTLQSKDFGGEFGTHSVLKNLQEGASATVLGPSLQLTGSIGNNTRTSTELFTDREGWKMGKRISEDAF